MNELSSSDLQPFISRVQLLSLEEKVSLLTGASSWTLHPLPSIGLRALVVSDGPAGVRGVTDTPEETAASFPSPSALAATWDTGLAKRVGALFAAESRRHGVDIVLNPVVNLQRTPVGGRHFECFSEDPLLSGDMAGSQVASMQAQGVGACVKHFVANDSETERTKYVAKIDERTLREVYLAPFETVVIEAGAWTVMAAYNGLDDGYETASATEHRRLLTDILKREWGFDGLVMSDWTAAQSTVASARAGLDLVMPGPGGPWEEALVKAVQQGEVDESVIDDKVRRILAVAARARAFEDQPPPRTPTSEPASTLLRELSARSMVVLKDSQQLLPQRPLELGSVALIGPGAVEAFTQGGGSAHVNPDYAVTPEQGLREALGSHTVLSVNRGGYARPHLPELDLSRTRQDDNDLPGVRLTFVDEHDRVLDTLDCPTWNGWLRQGVPEEATSVILTTSVDLTELGTHWLGIGIVGAHHIHIDGTEVSVDETVVDADGVVLDSSVNAPPGVNHAVEISQPRTVSINARLQILTAEGWGRFVRAALRHQTADQTVDQEIAAAVAAATDAELAVVVVGTNNEVESEGWDRSTLALPGRQDELVRSVAAVNERTIVIVNAGAPVLLPWWEDVHTIVWAWFPGQECGHALADVLFGVTEPAGRLPWTLPKSSEAVLVPDAIPSHGVVDYSEGIHSGYRGYLRRDIPVAAPFGHGLGWTDWEYLNSTITNHDDGDLEVTVEVRNTGSRAGTEVVQAYLESDDTSVERPVRWLAGFATVTAEPGATTLAHLSLASRAFHVWDPNTQQWTVPPGDYRVRIGRSSLDLRLENSVVRGR